MTERLRREKFWPKRLPRSISIPGGVLSDNLAVTVDRYGERPAVVFLGKVLTWATILKMVETLAAGLQSVGVQKGDRVIVDMQNCPQLLIAHYAILHVGAIVVPLNPMNKAAELKHYIKDSGAKVAFVSAEISPEMVKASDGLDESERLSHLIVTNYLDLVDSDSIEGQGIPDAWRDWLLARADSVKMTRGTTHTWKDVAHVSMALKTVEAAPSDLAILPYTSGTTGLPKGCMITHSALMHQVAGISLYTQQSADSTLLVAVPMFHVTGLIAIMHTAVYTGATLVVMPRWDREYAGTLITNWGVTDWINIPTMIIDLFGSPNFAKFDLNSLRWLGGGGAAMPRAVAQRLLDTYGIFYVEAYGLTETSSPSHHNPPDRTKQQCLGLPFFSTESFIADPESLEEVKQGEIGEIVIRGPQLFVGYWNNPDATEAAFFVKEGRKFFRTGDIGWVDEEGYFFLTDRLKRMINASGFKVWPAEVESILHGHPEIQEACVIGVPDSYRGETVKAFIVLRKSAAQGISEENIIDWARENMSVYKVPRIVEFVAELPKSGSGKVQWLELQKREAASA